MLGGVVVLDVVKSIRQLSLQCRNEDTFYNDSCFFAPVTDGYKTSTRAIQPGHRARGEEHLTEQNSQQSIKLLCMCPCQHLIKYSSISSRGFLKKSAGVIGKTVGVCVSFYDDTGRGTWTRHADHDLTNQCVNICSAAGRRILTPNCKSRRESRT